MGLFPCPGVIWLSRFFGGRPGRFGGPAVLGFFLEKSTEVLLPTSCAGVEEELGPRPGRERKHWLQPVGPGRDHTAAPAMNSFISHECYLRRSTIPTFAMLAPSGSNYPVC